MSAHEDPGSRQSPLRVRWIYVCGGSLRPFKVDQADFVFDDLEIVEYLTFMAVMEEADIQLSL